MAKLWRDGPWFWPWHCLCSALPEGPSLPGAWRGRVLAVAAVEAVRSQASSGDVAALALFLDRCVVTVPAGEFIMGNDEGPANERPQRRVTLDGFEIDRFEVTNVLYQRFLHATGREPPPYWSEGDFRRVRSTFPWSE